MKTTHVPKGYLKDTALKLLEGARQYEASLELPSDFVPAITADHDTFDSALNVYTRCKDAERTARASRNAALRQGYAFVANTIQVLKPHLGRSYNVVWDRAGFPQGSIAAPRTHDQLISRLASLKAYLAANPAHEVAGANATAAAADTAAKAMADATGALQTALVDKRAAAKQVDVAQARLAQRLRAAEEILATKLSADDLRWYGFGLPRRVDLRIAEAPGKPVLLQIGPGAVELTWPKAIRARRYRIFLQKPEDPEPLPIETVSGLYAVLRDLPTGEKLRFTLVAANATGESRPSEAAEIALTWFGSRRI